MENSKKEYIPKDPEPIILNEPALRYTAGGYNKHAVIETIARGLNYSTFRIIQNKLPFSETDWADMLDVSVKTLQRYKHLEEDFLLKSTQTERIIEVAEVSEMGQRVFGSLESFNRWLNEPNFALGNRIPFTLLKSSYGKELLLNELTRIDHGIFA